MLTFSLLTVRLSSWSVALLATGPRRAFGHPSYYAPGGVETVSCSEMFAGMRGLNGQWNNFWHGQMLFAGCITVPNGNTAVLGIASNADIPSASWAELLAVLGLFRDESNSPKWMDAYPKAGPNGEQYCLWTIEMIDDMWSASVGPLYMYWYTS